MHTCYFKAGVSMARPIDQIDDLNQINPGPTCIILRPFDLVELLICGFQTWVSRMHFSTTEEKMKELNTCTVDESIS